MTDDFFACKCLKYKQQYHRTLRTQKHFITLQGRYHGVQDIMTTPQPLTFRTCNYTNIKNTTRINIQTITTKNYLGLFILSMGVTWGSQKLINIYS